MSGAKTSSHEKVRNVADGEIAPRQTSNKYHFAPQSVKQKRADEWADIEAMENRERKEIDAQQYREYMDAQAEKAAQSDDNFLFCEFMYMLSLFMMGAAFYSLNTFLSGLSIFCVIFSRNNFYNALHLRGGSSLTPRGKGDKR